MGSEELDKLFINFSYLGVVHFLPLSRAYKAHARGRGSKVDVRFLQNSKMTDIISAKSSFYFFFIRTLLEEGVCKKPNGQPLIKRN